MSKPDFVLIGAGRMGRAHLEAARNLGLEVAAIIDPSDETHTLLKEEFDITEEQLFKNVNDYSADLSNSLVTIATTAETHLELVLWASSRNAGYVFCEKPMARSVEDCETMIAACKASNTHLAINHQMRFMDQYVLIKKEIEEGNLGALGSMNVTAGCFGLAMNGSHYVEAYRYLTGKKIKSVSARFDSEEIPNPRGPNFFDQTGEVMAASEDGVSLLISCGAKNGHGMTVMYATRFGHVFCDELEAVYHMTTRKPEHQDQPVTRYGMPWDRSESRFTQATNVSATQAVMEALLAETNYPSGADGLHAVSVLVAANKSAAEGGRRVDLDDLGEYHNKQFQWA